MAPSAHSGPSSVRSSGTRPGTAGAEAEEAEADGTGKRPPARPRLPAARRSDGVRPDGQHTADRHRRPDHPQPRQRTRRSAGGGTLCHPSFDPGQHPLPVGAVRLGSRTQPLTQLVVHQCLPPPRCAATATCTCAAGVSGPSSRCSSATAREVWLFTVPTDIPSTSEVSRSDRSKACRSTTHARLRNGSLRRAPGRRRPSTHPDRRPRTRPRSRATPRTGRSCDARARRCGSGSGRGSRRRRARTRRDGRPS